MKQRGSNKKVANRLLAVSSAAVLAVYAAGYTRTRSAADRFDGQAAERRPGAPRPPRTASPIAEFRPAALNTPAGAPSPAASASSSPERDAAGKPALIASAQPVPAKANVPDLAAAPSPAVTPLPSTPAAPVATLPVQPAAPATDYKAVIAAAAPPWKDGTYDGWGTCRHGDLQVTVVIEGGRIASSAITQCLTRYSCDIIEKLPGQVVQRQSPEVSYVSGATQSTDAYYWAVVVALGKAK